MKKLVVISLLMVFNSLIAIGQDFRKATWGMSPNEVKATELSKPIQESSDVLAYETTIAGYDALLGYIFIDGRLTRAKYIIAETHSNNNDYISDYYMLNGLLSKKYGEAIEDEEYWINDSSFKNDKSFWGHCISMGDLVLYSTFSTARTEIELTLSAEDYVLINSIQYSSSSDELKDLEEEKILEDL